MFWSSPPTPPPPRHTHTQQKKQKPQSTSKSWLHHWSQPWGCRLDISKNERWRTEGHGEMREENSLSGKRNHPAKSLSTLEPKKKKTPSKRCKVSNHQMAKYLLAWEANSAVGTNITTRGLLDEDLASPWSSSCLRRCITGARYASVFPDPLWSAIMQLFPLVTGTNAMAYCYMSKSQAPIIIMFKWNMLTW